MPRFRKKPVVIEAVRWDPEAKPTDFPKWFWDRFGGNTVVNEHRSLAIQTLEGVMIAGPGDWIIQGVKGEIYPCKPDIFEATYEPAE